MSYASNPRDALHAQVTSRTPVTGRVAFFRGWCDGSRGRQARQGAMHGVAVVDCPRRHRLRPIALSPKQPAVIPPDRLVRKHRP